jgi:hypothetical protein
MRIRQTIKLLGLGLTLMIVAAACGDGINSASDRISGVFGESERERLSSRVDETTERLSGASSDLSVYASETVTLNQLHQAGIPVGSTGIACDDPLDMVIVEGMFERENIFQTGIALGGGVFEAMAMDMVAEIYDPETDMPLGMIGDETGGSLTGVTQSDDGSIATGTVDGGLVFSSAEQHQSDRELVPEAVCADD